MLCISDLGDFSFAMNLILATIWQQLEIGCPVDMTEDISPPPVTKNRRNIAVSPVVVGLHIEISNRFIEDYESVIRFMKWLDAQ